MFQLSISGIVRAVDFQFYRFIGMYVMQVKFNFGADQKPNMVTRWPSWIFISSQYFKKRLSRPNWLKFLHVWLCIQDTVGSNMAVKYLFWILVSTKYFMNLLCNWFEILEVYWYLYDLVMFDFGADWKSNMATRQQSCIFISSQYLKKRLSNRFEILQVYWNKWDEGHVTFWSRLEFRKKMATRQQSWIFVSIQ